ncbi:MAG TPA: TIGR03085 family metal-binding protein [Jiangellaceae bacterium]|nr:TIGR03085 family metal-binding protein [Jiangellaceae bacterium]
MTAFARSERLALCETLRTVGPDAPTLCEGWLTRDLAAHLVLRESRPDAAPGIVVSALAGRTARIQRSLAELSWPHLVDRVQHPPLWTPLSWGPIEEAANLTEHFVHHEDVLRAQPGWTEPRPLDPAYEGALWSAVASRGRLFFRRSPVGVVLRDTEGATATVRRPPSDGVGSVVMTGRPGELMLYAFGRTDHARVELDGASEDVAAFRGAHLGL